tara:strand:+ start:741 stop:941 length:201 start_codon:yes stop_codon:yes gene_type:complete
MRSKRINTKFTVKEFEELYYLVYDKIKSIEFSINLEKEREKPNKKRLNMLNIDLDMFKIIRHKLLK